MAGDVVRIERAKTGRAVNESSENTISKVTPSKEDLEILRALRVGRQVSFQENINYANWIRDPETKDAALGSLLKRRMRTILGSKALLHFLPYHQKDLMEFANMLSSDSKRESMKERIALMSDRKK